VIHKGIQIKAVEGNALFADLNFDKIRANLGVKAVPVHPNIEWRIP